ncbi:MAG: DUF2232 domain-containing protein [Candidatus Latescibacterota bacterium]|nr:DUF2232 domain-containing protein [Candidatus Latescibacterota bacterium]
MFHLLGSLTLVAAMLIGARRYGARRMAFPALIPLLLSMAAPFQWVLMSAPLIGWLAAVQVERGRSYGDAIAAASIPGAGLGLLLLGALHGEMLPTRDLVDSWVPALQEVGTEAPLPDTVSLEQLVETMLAVLPGTAYLSLLMVAVLGYRVAEAVGPRFGTQVPAAVPLHRWRLWETLIWALIVCLAMSFLADEGLISGLAVNGLLVLSVLYAVQGLAVARWLMRRMQVQRFLEVLVYALLVFTSGVSVLALAGIGLMDTWFDWRRLGHRRHGDAVSQPN